jgi:hypothetical protein
MFTLFYFKKTPLHLTCGKTLHCIQEYNIQSVRLTTVIYSWYFTMTVCMIQRYYFNFVIYAWSMPVIYRLWRKSTSGLSRRKLPAISGLNLFIIYWEQRNVVTFMWTIARSQHYVSANSLKNSALSIKFSNFYIYKFDKPLETKLSLKERGRKG